MTAFEAVESRLMCVILLALSSHPKYPFIVAANRDEFYARPTVAAGFWEDAPQVLGGRDLREGGTWLGITRHGRFAAVTNFRGPDAGPAEPVSRGRLVGDFLLGDASGEDYVARVADAADRYRGFNLLAGTGTGLYYFANRGDVQPRLVAPGVHALSNHLLNTPWPKVERARAGLSELLTEDDIDTGALLELLRDDTRAAADQLPDTGVGAALETELSPIFIRTEAYGTRCSTLLSIDTRGEVRFIERTFVDGHAQADKQFQFRLSPAASERTGAELRSGS